MKYELKLLFFLTILVVIPCALLSVFAFQTLQVRELIIEKKIEESYSALSSNMIKHIIDKMDKRMNIIHKTFMGKQGILQNYEALALYPNQNIFLENIHLLDKNFHFIFPKRRPLIKNSTNQYFFVENYHIFEVAYFYEFQKENYLLAIEEYQKIVASSQRWNDLSHALISIARCNFKVKNFEKALETYKYLTTLFQDRRESRSIGLMVEVLLQMGEIYKIKKNYSSYYQKLLDLFEYLIFNEFCLTNAKFKYFYDIVTKKLLEVSNINDLTPEEKKYFFRKHKDLLFKKKEYIQQEKKIKTMEHFIIPYLKKNSEKKGYISYKEANKEFLFYYSWLEGRSFSGYVLYQIHIRNCVTKLIMPVLKNQDAGKDVRLMITNRAEMPIFEDIENSFFSVVSQPIKPAFPFWNVTVYLKNVRSLDELSHYRSRLYSTGIIVIILTLILGIYVSFATFVKAAKSTRLKSDFVSSVTHELKTPLTAIKMFVETLLMGRAKNKEEQKEYLQIIASESERLSRLIDRILDFARMEQRKRTFHFNYEDIKDVVEEVSLHFQNQILNQDSCEINLSIEENLPKLFLDKEAIRDVMMNLISNAHKYNNKDKQIIDIKIEKVGSHEIVVSVKDNGIGIPRHETNRIFEKFYRIEDPLSRRIEGTGLGLALVKSIIKAHRGKVRVQSKINLGSEFIITLPVVTRETIMQLG